MPGISRKLEKHTHSESYGMDVKLKLPRNDLFSFRITYGNTATQNTRDGVTVVTGSLEQYNSEIQQRITEEGYYLEKLDDCFWTHGCYYAYLRSSDATREYPRMKVYVHPNEMSGWAPKKDINRLLQIAQNNPFLVNVCLVYTDKVYNMDDARYLEILTEAEERILEWLAEYKKHHYGHSLAAGMVFQKVFGIKRLKTKHLSYRDYLAISYVDQLVRKKL